jgi:hypothetical protein
MRTDPKESANGHAVRIDMLREHGWVPWTQYGVVRAMDSMAKPRQCVWIEGKLAGAERSAFLVIDDGRIIMHAEQQDYEFLEFIRLLTHGPEPVRETKQVVDRQRSLF